MTYARSIGMPGCAGLTERFTADDCDVEAGALDRIIDYGGGQPRSTMLIAQKTHLATVELDTRVIDLNWSNRAYLPRWPPTGSPTSRSSNASGGRTGWDWWWQNGSLAVNRSTRAFPAARSGEHSKLCEMLASSTAGAEPNGPSAAPFFGVTWRRSGHSRSLRRTRRRMHRFWRIARCVSVPGAPDPQPRAPGLTQRSVKRRQTRRGRANETTKATLRWPLRSRSAGLRGFFKSCALSASIAGAGFEPATFGL